MPRAPRALPGVVTQGDTVEQCLEQAQESIGLHPAAMAEDAEPIPEEHEKHTGNQSSVPPDAGFSQSR